jgi:cobalamin biosynthesis Mg chelatase CobN
VYPKDNNVDVTQKIKNLSGNVIDESGFTDMRIPVGTVDKPVTNITETPPIVKTTETPPIVKTTETPMTKKTTTPAGLSWQTVISIILGILSLIMLVCIIYILIRRRNISSVKSRSPFTFT